MLGSPKGCQIVAGGRSEAETTGTISIKKNAHPEGVQDSGRHSRRILSFITSYLAAQIWHPFEVRFVSSLLPGGLRCAPTTGYSLATLRVAAAANRVASGECADTS